MYDMVNVLIRNNEHVDQKLAIFGSFHINSTNDLNHDVTKFDETWLFASFLRFE